MKRWASIVGASLLLLIPKEARLEPVFQVTPAFEELLAAPVIVVAEPANPAWSKEVVPIPGLPDFEKFNEHFVVVSVLKDEAPPSRAPKHANPPPEPPMSISAGAAIVVHSDRLTEDLHLHWLYYKQGTSKSPLYEYYAPQLPVDGRRILFLRRDPWQQRPEYARVIGKGEEGVAAQKEVVKRIKSKE